MQVRRRFIELSECSPMSLSVSELWSGTEAKFIEIISCCLLKVSKKIKEANCLSSGREV